MDDPTANKSHIPTQSWTGQNGWPTTATQGSLFNPLPGSQHHSLGLSSFQRPSCDQVQMSSQSCMSYMNTSPSTHHSALFKPSHNSSGSTALFAHTAIPRSSHGGSYVQLPHTSSVQLTANQGKNTSPLSYLKSTQTPQPCQPQQLPPLSANNLYKTTFHRPSLSQANGHQDLPSGLPSCAQQGFSTSQATSRGVNMEFAGGADNMLSRSSAASQEQCQWMSSSHSRGATNLCGPDLSAGPHKESPQEAREENVLPLASDGRQHSALLHQHAQLVQQVADLEKCMETVSPDDCSDGQSSQPVNQFHPSVGESSPCEQATTSETQQVQQSNEKSEDEPSETCDTSEDPVSEAESEKMENVSEESDEDGDSDYLPNQDSNPPPNSDCSSSAESSPSSPSVSADEKPSPVKRRLKLAAVCLPEKICVANLKKPPKTTVLTCSKSKDKHPKKNYCLFCSKPVGKMSRHMETIHSDKTEVAAAFQYPPNSKERLKIWHRLINEGNFLHNKIVLKTGKGVLTVRKRPKNPKKAWNFLHCLYCRGLYMSSNLTRHMKSCPEKEKSDQVLQHGKRNVTAQRVLETCADDLGITSGFKNILSQMTYNEVTQMVMDDELILQYGEFLFDQYGSFAKKAEYIRQNIRQIARLVLQAQKIGPLKKLEDFFLPSNFPHVVSAVNILAGYNAEKKKYTTPSLAIKLGYSLQKVCVVVEEKAARSGDASLAESAKNFLVEYKNNWNKLISGGALTTLRKNKLKNLKKVPAAQDIRRLSFHLENVHLHAEKNLRDNPSMENYVALVKVILTRTLIFNRRKSTEVSVLKVTDFMSRKKSEADASMDISVSDLERSMCGHFTRIDIQGGCGRLVPVFLKPTFISAMELFLKVRETCSVPSENPFLFARPNALSAYRGDTCIHQYLNECGAEDPQRLTLKKIQKHYTTMLQLMNLDENEADQILGPDNQVRTLRRDSSMQVDDAEMYLDERLRLAPKATGKGKKGGKSGNKHKWDEAEVQAVERHMMRFITHHKVPQKNDCIACLEAEAEALKNRSWKGVKDYVRNRITTRRSVKKSGAKDPQGLTSAAVRKPHATEQQMSTSKQAAGPTLQRGGAKMRSGAQNKGKYKWGEAEVLAVERHMMRFIREHRIPQKNDCTLCLEAEPEALRNRSWKGVKDYVRNRITALSRQAKSTNSKWWG